MIVYYWFRVKYLRVGLASAALNLCYTGCFESRSVEMNVDDAFAALRVRESGKNTTRGSFYDFAAAMKADGSFMRKSEIGKRGLVGKEDEARE